MLPLSWPRLHSPRMLHALAISLSAPLLMLAAPAFADLRAGSPTPSPTSPPPIHTAWEHWGPDGLDPQHFPYPVVFVGNTLQNIEKQDIASVIQAALHTWNSVACSTAALHFAGFRENLNEVTGHEIPIYIPDSDYWIGHENLLASTNMTRPAIALNTTHFDWSLDPAPFQSLSARNTSDSTTDLLIVDFQSVLTHELGHVLGLWHTQDDATAAMVGRYLPDGNQRHLAADDKFALCHLYPRDSPTTTECTDDSHCPHGPCVSDQTFHVCQKSQARPGDYCALDLLHCPHGCVIDSPPTGTGYCTTPCQTHADCPRHFECTTNADAPANDAQSTCLLIRPDTPQTPGETTSCSTAMTRHTPRPLASLPTLALLLAALWHTRKIRSKAR